MTKIKVHDPITGKKVEVEVEVTKCPPSPRHWVQRPSTTKGSFRRWLNQEAPITQMMTYVPAGFFSKS